MINDYDSPYSTAIRQQSMASSTVSGVAMIISSDVTAFRFPMVFSANSITNTQRIPLTSFTGMPRLSQLAFVAAVRMRNTLTPIEMPSNTCISSIFPNRPPHTTSNGMMRTSTKIWKTITAMFSRTTLTTAIRKGICFLISRFMPKLGWQK
jgi:hypothetical protein